MISLIAVEECIPFRLGPIRQFELTNPGRGSRATLQGAFWRVPCCVAVGRGIRSAFKFARGIVKQSPKRVLLRGVPTN
jgi:hypothetical protein